jgi:hypothetical protein
VQDGAGPGVYGEGMVGHNRPVRDRAKALKVPEKPDRLKSKVSG